MTRFGPSILVEAATSPPTRILVDAGRGATQRLFAIGGRDLLSGIDLVLLTHLHSDHVVGLPDLWLTGWLFGRAKPFSLKGPEGTAALMAHLEKAFEFDVKTRSDVDERLHAQVRNPAAVQRIIEHHTLPEDAGRIFSAVQPRLAVYSHIVPSPATEKDLLAPTRKTYSGPLAVGYDLMTISIGEKIAIEKRVVFVE